MHSFSARPTHAPRVFHELTKERLPAAQTLVQFGDGEKVVAVLDARMHEEHPNLVFVTASGTVKRTAMSEFAEASGRQNGLVAMKLAPEDRVVSVFSGWDDYELLLVTANGQRIRFGEGEGRPGGRAAGGMRGHRLQDAEPWTGAATGGTSGTGRELRCRGAGAGGSGGAGARRTSGSWIGWGRCG